MSKRKKKILNIGDIVMSHVHYPLPDTPIFGMIVEMKKHVCKIVWLGGNSDLMSLFGVMPRARVLEMKIEFELYKKNNGL